MKESWKRFDRRQGHKETSVKINLYALLRMKAQWAARTIRDRLHWRCKLKKAQQLDQEFREMLVSEVDKRQELREALLRRLAKDLERDLQADDKDVCATLTDTSKEDKS